MVCPAILLQSFIWISLMAKGVQYDVTHIVSKMCVVQQSMVLIPCKHTSPNEQVSSAEWLFERSSGQRVRVSQDPAFVGRVECVQPAAGNCSLLLRNARESDAGIFRFVLNTTSGQTWTNNQGIQLEVTDANLEVKTESDAVMEGDLIMFVCGSCIPSMTVPTYIWRKDGQLHSQHHGENILVLESVELKDGGRYSCTISGHEGLNSASHEITVRPGYPPKSVSVSISPSGEIVEGDSVTLICSSDSNPPALNFSWFKGEVIVGSGIIYSISKTSSDHSGEYKCKSRNKHGETDSDNVMMNVKYAPRDVVVTLNGSAEIVEGDSVTLICSSDSNPPALNFSWFKKGMFVGSGRIYNISNIRSDHSGEYKCRSGNKYGVTDSDNVMMNVKYAPRDVVVTLNSSAEIVEGDSVTLICSSDSNPPALNFSWFKENQSSAVGSGQSFIISSFNSSHSGRYYCEAQNKYGSQRSASVSLTSAGDQKAVLYAAAAIGAMLICICIFIVVKKNIRKTGDAGGQSGVSKQEENNSTAVTDQTSAKPPKPADLNESVYASITHSRPREQQRAGDEDEVQYATVQHHRNTRNTTAEDGCQNGNSVSAGSNTEKADDSNVIYSSIKSS